MIQSGKQKEGAASAAPSLALLFHPSGRDKGKLILVCREPRDCFLRGLLLGSLTRFLLLFLLGFLLLFLPGLLLFLSLFAAAVLLRRAARVSVLLRLNGRSARLALLRGSAALIVGLAVRLAAALAVLCRLIGLCGRGILGR